MRTISDLEACKLAGHPEGRHTIAICEICGHKKWLRTDNKERAPHRVEILKDCSECNRSVEWFFSVLRNIISRREE